MGIQVHIEEVSSDTLERMNNILCGIGRGDACKQALDRAFRRASDTGKTEAARAVAGTYSITQQTFRANTMVRTSVEGTKVQVVFSGRPISLIEFATTGGQQGNVKVAVRRGPKKPLEHAWKGLPGLHIWERVGSKRLPIEKMYGPSGPQMLQDSGVSKQVGDRMMETAEKRLEHEIARIVAGY